MSLRIRSAIVGVAGALAAQAALATTSFGDDVAFLRAHTDIIVLHDDKSTAQVAIAPAWQGRVMTSTAAGESGGLGFGWINRKLITSGQLAAHINAYGGEDRLWLGPEGGQFSVFFAKGAPFDLDHWFVPRELDTLPFQQIDRDRNHASFKTSFALTNYSGTRFQVAVERDVRVIEPATGWSDLGMKPLSEVTLVAYESRNTLVNAGTEPWKKQTGLLSIWVLGMFNPSPSATIVVPIKAGPDSALGTKVTADYFGLIPPDRLRVTASAILLRGDGQFRSKIGVTPRRSLGRLGSYDADHHVLTIVQFNQPQNVTDYVNSLWKMQSDPFGGDAINSYNDGPPAPGAPPLGPFFEMETSSPAAALTPGGRIEHTHRTIHLVGSETALDSIAHKVLGVSLADIQSAFNVQ